MKAGEVVFQELLDGKKQYVVPLYQRRYSWSEPQWGKLWEDVLEVYMLERPRNHFIGSVVTQQIDSAPQSVSRYTLIDGQQRMTTLFLLLAAIRDLPRCEEELKEEINETCLLNKFAGSDERMKLTPTQEDREALRAVVDGQGRGDQTQIGKAYLFFCEKVDEEDTEGKPISASKLHRCVVSHLDLVSISLGADDSPNRIFESLNNTGMPLSVADLIRNYMLMQISDPAQQERAYRDYWHPLERRLGDRAADFFWRYLMMTGDLPRYDDVYEAVQTRLTDGGGVVGTIQLLGEFDRASKYYAEVVGLEPGPDGAVSKALSRLNRWEVEVAYPFLMRLIEGRDQGRWSRGEVLDVLGAVESFIVRRAVCGVPTNRLRRVFAQLAGNVGSSSAVVTETKQHFADNVWPDDAAFVAAIVGYRLYVPSRLARARLMLESLEEADEGNKERPVLDDKISIEHVMPQTLSEHWRNRLGPDADETHDQWLDTLGNLTLTAYNSELSNKPFYEKKNLLGVSSLSLNKSVVCHEDWNGDSIRLRGEYLAKEAARMWPR